MKWKVIWPVENSYRKLTRVGQHIEGSRGVVWAIIELQTTLQIIGNQRALQPRLGAHISVCRAGSSHHVVPGHGVRGVIKDGSLARRERGPGTVVFPGEGRCHGAVDLPACIGCPCPQSHRPICPCLRKQEGVIYQINRSIDWSVVQTITRNIVPGDMVDPGVVLGGATVRFVSGR